MEFVAKESWDLWGTAGVREMLKRVDWTEEWEPGKYLMSRGTCRNCGAVTEARTYADWDSDPVRSFTVARMTTDGDACEPWGCLGGRFGAGAWGPV